MLPLILSNLLRMLVHLFLFLRAYRAHWGFADTCMHLNIYLFCLLSAPPILHLSIFCFGRITSSCDFLSSLDIPVILHGL